MSAKAGWYPDPGGGQNLYRFWDGRAWSAATTYNPQAPLPATGLGAAGQPPVPTPPVEHGPSAYGPATGAYANFQAVQKRKSPVGWWIAAAALVVVIIVVAVIAVRAIGGGGGGVTTPPPGQPSQDVCPKVSATAPPSTAPQPNDGRVHGGPVSYPELGTPWGPPQGDERVPFGRDVASQL
ncbi:MAG TPA: DUF2510 domain-containing protein, partial [Microlunatus sp.]